MTGRSRAEIDRRVRYLVAGTASVVFLLGWAPLVLLGLPLVGVLISLVVSAALTSQIIRRSDQLVLRSVRAAPVGPEGEPALANLLESLGHSSGVPQPRLHLIETDALNALTVGLDPRRSSVVVTTGLRDALNRIEAEGVLAHAVTRIASGETRVATVAATTIGLPLLVADACFERGGLFRLVGWMSFPLCWVAARVLAALVDPVLDLRADVSSVALTRYPPGLASALEKFGAADTAVSGASAATTALFFLPPFADGQTGPLAGLRRRFDPHFAVDERVAVLREL